MKVIRLRELRERLGISQEELAERVGCHPNTIRRWELGYREPRSSDIQKLCEILSCTEGELLGVIIKQEFEVKIVMGVKSLTNLSGVAVADNSFIYGVDDNEPQIVMMGKVGIGTPEERENALAEIIRKFKAACWMFDHKADAEQEK